jgi:hypothetical protein
MTDCAEFEISLGAYVLGALAATERGEVERHLASCRSCSAELAELTPLPGLLSRLTLDDATSSPAAPDDALLERLLVAADRGRRHETRRRWLAVAAAVVFLVGGSAAGVAGWRATHAGVASDRVSASANGVRMQVQLVGAQTGTRLALSLTGVAAEERCRIVAVSDTGSRDVAGSWVATYSGTAKIDATTSIPRAHLARLVIQTYDGTRLVAAKVPPESA